VNTEVYLAEGGLRAQFGYASRRGIPLAIIIGPDEAAEGMAAVKDLRSGGQETVALAELSAKVKGLLGV